MTIAVQALLETFDRLSDTDRQEAAVEILRRVSPSEGELPEDTLLEAADALFCALDLEEAANAGP
jgi:NADH:ubiquinone oxidoreductase subunit E